MPSFKSLFSYLLNSEFVFDKPQSVIRTRILHIALVVGGDALHHLSVAVMAGDLYGHAAELVLDVHVGERKSLMPSFNLIPVFISCSSFCLFSGPGGTIPPIPNPKSLIQLKIPNSKFLIPNSIFFSQLEKSFFPTGKVIFCALSNHTTKVRQAHAAIIRFSTLQYDSVRFHMLFGSPSFLTVRPGNLL